MSKTMITAFAIVALFWYVIINVIPFDALLFFIALALIALPIFALRSKRKAESEE